MTGDESCYGLNCVPLNTQILKSYSLVPKNITVFAVRVFKEEITGKSK